MPDGNKKDMHAATVPTPTRTLIKIQRSGSCSGGLYVSESSNAVIPIHLTAPTKLNYTVQSYKINSASNFMISFRIHNYDFSSIYLRKLIIKPIVQISLAPVTVLINKVEMPFWQDYLSYDTSEGRVKLCCHKNTSLEFYGTQLVKLMPITISINFSIAKPVPKNNHLNLSAKIAETTETVKAGSTDENTPLIPASIYRGQDSGHDFFRMRSFKRKNLLGSSPESFLAVLIDNLHNPEVKTIISLQMKNHLIKSLKKDSNLTLYLARLSEFKDYSQKLQKLHRLTEETILAAQAHCMQIDAEITKAELSSSSSITAAKMVSLLQHIDKKSNYIDQLNAFKLEIIALEALTKIFVNDNEMIADYLTNNLSLICKTPNIMIAWAIAKKVTLRIWEYYGTDDNKPEKRMFAGQSHLLPKNKSLDVLHDAAEDKYYSLVAVTEIEKMLKTPLALRLRLFNHKPSKPKITTPPAPKANRAPMRFSHDC